MKFIVIGITDNPQPWFPQEVIEIIKNGKVFSGGKRHHEIVAPLLPAGSQWIDITVPLDAVFDVYSSLFALFPTDGRLPVAFHSSLPLIVFASGDPLFFGFANTIRRKMPEAEIVLYPSFNSLQLLAHRLVLPYHDMRIVSLTGRPWPELDRALIERSPKLGVLTDREHTPQAIARRLLDYGYTYYYMYVGEHLGHPQRERVSRLTLEEALQRDFEQPNCLILHAEEPVPPASFGLPDSEFALLNGRERMITKMPIRLLTLQMLDLPRRRVLWDVGFCTGSVSIEARLRFPHLQIEAFEIRPECDAIIRQNMRRHGVPGIGIHIGDFRSVCCDVIATYPAPPDAVFIGGHGGHLKEIMARARQCMQPGGIIVMNAVTSQSRQLFAEACSELGLVWHQPLHIALNDYNPIDILKCELPS